MTWDEYEERTNATYGGGHHDDGMMPAYRHGINTVFNVLRAAFPSGPDAMGKTEEYLSALRYMADSANWDAETGLLKRPGGGRQEGIVLYSASIKPWAFAAQFI